MSIRDDATPETVVVAVTRQAISAPAVSAVPAAPATGVSLRSQMNASIGAGVPETTLVAASSDR